jgi:hypothetical protein
MSNNKWSEQDIEQLLGQVPKVQDTRSKDEVLKRLHEDARLTGIQTKKRKSWVPPAVAIASVLTLSLLTATMLNQSNDESAQMADSAAEEALSIAGNEGMEEQSMTMMESEESADTAPASKKSEESYSTMDSSVKIDNTALYPNEISDDVTVFKLGLAGDAANSVPVTFLIPKSMIKSEIGEETPTSLELYESYASRIDEGALGFFEYHPYKGTFSVEGATLKHFLPKKHGYDTASGTITVYFQTLRDTFQDFSQIEFLNEDGTTVEFDQSGEPSKPMSVNGAIQHNNYFLYKQSDGSEYLTPNFGQTFPSITEALLQMKGKPNDVYSSVIPREVNYEVEKEGDVTKIIFTDPLDLEQFDANTAMQMIEGMLLTGASFGETLKMENIVQQNWNGFDFTKPMPVPVGANELTFLLNE